jgi:catechol 2,3-dioxygenase-like lactoylglutathione lyase family enzyme
MSKPLDVQGLYAAMLVSNLKTAEAFYMKVLGRGPDDRPMPTLIQWRGFGMAAGIQLFEGAGTPGGSRMTLVVPNMEKAKDELRDRGLKLGDVSQGTYGKIAQLADEDGNTITFAEPPRSS